MIKCLKKKYYLFYFLDYYLIETSHEIKGLKICYLQEVALNNKEKCARDFYQKGLQHSSGRKSWRNVIFISLLRLILSVWLKWVYKCLLMDRYYWTFFFEEFWEILAEMNMEFWIAFTSTLYLIYNIKYGYILRTNC